MRKVMKDDLPHIEGFKFIYPVLAQVSVSPFSKSETRFVKVININLKDYGSGIRKDKPMILVDSPGSEDTESKEVDLSNGLGIMNAISRARSVLPVIVINYQDMGGRRQQLKRQITYYSRMFTNIEASIEKTVYAFTHVPDQVENKEFRGIIQDIYNHRNETEKLDQNFEYVLSDMSEKAENNELIIVRPLDGTPKKVLTILETKESIEDPD